MNVSERSSHPSQAQIEALIDFLERNPNLAKGFLKTKNGRDRSRRQWEEISVRLNSMGGTIKTYQQWTKYWSDKKSGVKKKVAALAAAKRRTGGGVEDLPELSEIEEKIVALCGGAGFGLGDTHLGIPLFQVALPETSTQQMPQTETQSMLSHSNTSYLPHQESPAPEQHYNIVLTSSSEQRRQNRQTARRLFVSSGDVTQPSRSSLHDIHYEPCLSPPPPTLSHTPSPMPMSIGSTSSPHRRGRTVCAPTQDAGSSSSLYAQPPTPLQQSSATPVLQFEASPSRRGTTDNEGRRSVRTSRGAASSSRSTRSLPPSQRRTEFSTITERFLRVEEQRLEIQQSNARILQTMMEHSIDRDSALTQAVLAIAEGLKALAAAIKPNE